MPRQCSDRRVVKLQMQANLGQIMWSMEADILLSELFVLNTQILGIYIWLWKKLGLLTKSYQCDTRDTRGEVMFPLQVRIIIKTNNQIIKINSRVFTIKSCRSVQAWRTSVVLNNWETNLFMLQPRSANFQLAVIFHNMVISLAFNFGLRMRTEVTKFFQTVCLWKESSEILYLTWNYNLITQ